MPPVVYEIRKTKVEMVYMSICKNLKLAMDCRKAARIRQKELFSRFDNCSYREKFYQFLELWTFYCESNEMFNYNYYELEEYRKRQKISFAKMRLKLKDIRLAYE